MSLATRLSAALASGAPDGLSSGDLADDDVLTEVREAAVLVAVTDRADPGVLFIVRPPDMRTHAGQVAFPGGQVD
ncbi:MAG: coenzyme A pyrophosphatase, partial [Sphingomicrobium sp.]